MIKIKTILHYGGVCPFQLDALTNDDRLIYGRYRHGWIEVRIGAKDNTSEDAAVSSESIFREKIRELFKISSYYEKGSLNDEDEKWDAVRDNLEFPEFVYEHTKFHIVNA